MFSPWRQALSSVFFVSALLSACVIHLVKERPEFINKFYLLDINSEENEIFKEFWRDYFLVPIFLNVQVNVQHKKF